MRGVRSLSVGLLWAAAISALLMAACRERPEDKKASSKEEARRIFERQLQKVEAAARGGVVTNEFDEAVAFFSDLAGIEIRTDISSEVGLTPNQHTLLDLELVRRWFERNGDRLDWDEANRTVRLKATQGSINGDR
ncbi:MAG: hypothetical protein AMXMBFR36_00300 [Acidobacteriota bacterium]